MNQALDRAANRPGSQRVEIWWGHGGCPEDATPKCIYLTTCLAWVFAQMRNRPRKHPKPVGHRLACHPLGSRALLAGWSSVHPLYMWTNNVNGRERLACLLAGFSPGGMPGGKRGSSSWRREPQLGMDGVSDLCSIPSSMKTNCRGALTVFLLGQAALANGATGTISTVWEPATQSARVTSDYLDAKVSLAYPGFAGLSVDSLGKEHFSRVAMRPPAKPWRATEATRHGSWIEYRRPGSRDSARPRWALEIGRQEIWLESHWSADDPPESLVFEAENSTCHVT